MILGNFAKVVHADKIYRQPVTLLSRTLLFLIAFYGIGQGVMLFSTNPERWRGPSYAVVRAALPYYAWAGLSLGFGLLILYGIWKKEFYVRMIGHLGLATWTLTFAIGVAGAMVDPKAGNAGFLVFTFAAVFISVMTCIDETRPSIEFSGYKH